MEDLNSEYHTSRAYLLGKTYLPKNQKCFTCNESITYIAAGDRHTIILTESGRIHVFGDNNFGQLGLGHTNPVESVSCITKIKFENIGEKAILAACGRDSSLITTNFGSLYAFGLNNRCQLGIESKVPTTIFPYPVKINYFHSNIAWKQISMGAEHTCALSRNGTVYCWGSNEDGQCGQSTEHRILKMPTELKLDYSILSISCGYFHTALITANGRLLLFGNNQDSQLGCSIPDQSISSLEISLVDRIKDVACGNRHTVIVTDKGDVYTCGRGNHGQLGHGSRILLAENFKLINKLPERIVAIAAGKSHTAVLNFHGDMYVFGDGTYGKLSDETYTNKYEPSINNKFKEYCVSKVVCGGYQTIVLAQRKQILKEKKLMTNAVMNTMHGRVNDTYQSMNSDVDDDDFEPITSPLFDHTIPLIHIITDLTKHKDSNSRASQSLLTNSRLNMTTAKNNSSEQQSSNDDLSPSNERSLAISKINNEATVVNEDDILLNGVVSPKKLATTYSCTTVAYTESCDDEACPSLSSISTTSALSLSSTSSPLEINQIKSKTIYDCRDSSCWSTIETFEEFSITDTSSNSTRETVSTGSSTGLLSHIQKIKVSHKLLTNTNKNSRTCVLM